MTFTNATPANSAQFVRTTGNSGNSGGSDKPQTAQSSSSTPQTGVAALLAAKAQYLKTGIDKDAAIGDPDHDAPTKAPAPSNTSGVNITA
jgi:hypothetical protein